MPPAFATANRTRKKMRLGHWLLGGLTALTLSAQSGAPRVLTLDGARVGASSVVVVGERGGIHASSDLGQSWTARASGTAETLTGVAFADDRSGWVVGHGGVILATKDGGRTWVRQAGDESADTSFLDVLAIDPQTVVVTGAFGALRISRDAGSTWSRHPVFDQEPHLNRILADAQGTLWIVGEAGTVLSSSNRGESWTSHSEGLEPVSLYGAITLPQGELLVHGLRGHLYRHSAQSGRWEIVPNAHPVMLAASCRLKNGDLLLAGAARWWLLSRDHGRTVERLVLPITTAMAELITLPDGHILGLGEAGVIRFDPGTLGKP